MRLQSHVKYSGDGVLLKLGKFKQCQILNPTQFLKLMDPESDGFA